MINNPPRLFFKQTAVWMDVDTLMEFHCAVTRLAQSCSVVEEASGKCLPNLYDLKQQKNGVMVEDVVIGAGGFGVASYVGQIGHSVDKVRNHCDVSSSCVVQALSRVDRLRHSLHTSS